MIYLNPTRRDLIKQLMAMGAVGASGSLPSACLFAGERDGFRASLTAKSTWKNDAAYEALRKALLWRVNTPARYPDVIVQTNSENEIQEALRFAERNDLQVVCRSSGHNTAGAVLRNGGMLLDISSMTESSVDKELKTAFAEPGVNMHYFYQDIVDYGLIFPVAECHGVAMGGYLLGGGFSPIGYNWGSGPACYSILSADIILANGEKVTASKHENAELFWALRGIGPGFFGVVTRYLLQLYEHPETIMRTSYTFPLESLEKVISILNDLHEGKDERVEISLALTAHPEKSGSSAARLKITAHTNKSAGSEAEAKSILSHYQKSELSRLSFLTKENQRIQFSDLMYSPDRNLRNNSDNIWTNDARALLAITEHFENKPEGSQLLMALYHGRQSGSHRSDACYSSAGSHFLSSHLLWNNAEEDDENNRWYEKFNKILQPYTSSHYVNQVDNEHHPDRVRQSFSKESWQRLTVLRRKYDPQNRFYNYLGYD